MDDTGIAEEDVIGDPLRNREGTECRCPFFMLLTRRKRVMRRIGVDRKRGGEVTRDVGFTPDDHIDIFYAGWLSSPPFSGI